MSIETVKDNLSLKVLHIHTSDSGGGAETVFNITRTNPGVGTNYSGFIMRKNSYESIADVKFSIYSDAEIFLRPFNYFFSYNNYRVLRDFLSNHDVDLIHIHGFIGSLSSSILLAIKEFKRKRKIKIVQTLHDFHLACPNSLFYDFSKDKICEKCLGKKIKIYAFFNSCDRRGLAYSIGKAVRTNIANLWFGNLTLVDMFIAPSSLMKNKMLEDGLPANKICLIRNPVPINNTEITEEKKNIVCYFGRFSIEKDVIFILKAFEHWKSYSQNDFKLLLVGSGEMESEINQFIKNSRYLKDITVLDFMPYNKLVESIKLCKYFVMASTLYENAPMSLLEGLSLDIIPIVPDLGGMKESVEEIIQVGRTYKSRNIESFVECIDSLENNFAEELGKLKKRKYIVGQKLSVSSYYTELNKLYLKLCRNN